jgi:hypothetical protein
MIKFLALLCALLIYCTPLYAQELHLLGGILSDGTNHDQSYTWSLAYLQEIKKPLAFSVSKNERHRHLFSHDRVGLPIGLFIRAETIGRSGAPW